MERFKRFRELNGYKELFPYFWVVERLETDVSNLSKTLYKIKEDVPKGRSVSNFHGYQSLSNLDRLPEFSDFLELLKSFIEKKLSYEPYILNMWANINGRGSFNVLHNHGDSEQDSDLISGVYYLKCNKDSGRIGFLHPVFFNYHFWHDPNPKDLLLFPGYMPHHVYPNQSDEDRISIAFNMKFKGLGPIMSQKIEEKYRKKGEIEKYRK